MLGKSEGRRRRGHQRMRWLDGIIDVMDIDLGNGEGQDGLAWCSPWGCKELDTTERLNWTEYRFPLLRFQNNCRWGLQPWSQKTIVSWQENNDKPRKCVEKQRHYSADRGPYIQGSGLPVVTCGCENWTVKKAECQRISIFELWCWRGLLKVSWTARRSNQSILREINWKDWCWSWSSSILVIWCGRITH